MSWNENILYYLWEVTTALLAIYLASYALWILELGIQIHYWSEKRTIHFFMIDPTNDRR